MHPKTGDPKVRYVLRQSFEGKIDFLREIKKANLDYEVHAIAHFFMENGLW